MRARSEKRMVKMSVLSVRWAGHGPTPPAMRRARRRYAKPSRAAEMLRGERFRLGNFPRGGEALGWPACLEMQRLGGEVLPRAESASRDRERQLGAEMRL